MTFSLINRVALQRLSAGQQYNISLTDLRPNDPHSADITVSLLVNGAPVPTTLLTGSNGILSPTGTHFPGSTPGDATLTLPGVKICYHGTTTEVVDECIHNGEVLDVDAVVNPVGAPGALSWETKEITVGWWCWPGDQWEERVDFIPAGLATGVFDTVWLTYHGAFEEPEWGHPETPNTNNLPDGEEVWCGVIPLNNDDENLNGHPDVDEKPVPNETDLVSGGFTGWLCGWDPLCRYNTIVTTGTFTMVEGANRVNLWKDAGKLDAWASPGPNKIIGGQALYFEGKALSQAVGDVTLVGSCPRLHSDDDITATNHFTVMRLGVLGDIDHNDRIELADRLASQSQAIPGLILGCGTNNMTRIRIDTACKLNTGTVSLSLEGEGLSLWMHSPPHQGETPFLQSGEVMTWSDNAIPAISSDQTFYLMATSSGDASIDYQYHSPDDSTWFKASLPITVPKVDINGDYNRDGNPADDTHEADAVTFAGPKGFVILANNDDDNANDLPDAIEDDAINGSADMDDVTEFKVACLGIPAVDIPSTFTVEFKVVDPTNGTLSDAVRIFPQKTATQSGGNTVTMLNSAVKSCLGGTGFWTMGIEGIIYGKQAVVRMTLKDGATVLGFDEFRVMVAPYFVSPNNDNANEVFVSFTGVPQILDAFTSGLSGIAPLRKSSDYPLGAGSPTMRYIQDHVEFGYTRTAVGQTTFKSMQVILGTSPTDPDLQDLMTSNRAFYAEHAELNFGDLMVTPETSSRPYGTVVCGTGFAYKDFIKRQSVQPEGGALVEIDDTWMQTPHVDNLVAFIPCGSSFKVLVADLQLAVSILTTYSNTSVEAFNDPRPTYTNAAYSVGITNIQARLNAMYDALETGLGISKMTFIHIPVTFDPTASTGVKTFLPDMVNMQYVKSAGGEKVFLPKAYFEPFYTDPINGVKATLNAIGISDSEIQIVPTGAGGGSSPFHDGFGGDVHCISNPSMEPPPSP